MSDDEDDGWDWLALIAIPALVIGAVWEAASWPFRKLKQLARKHHER